MSAGRSARWASPRTACSPRVRRWCTTSSAPPAQNAANTANARALGPGIDRAGFLDTVSKAWEELDPDDYPITRALAKQVRDHDDREQFLAGVDLVLAGITAVHSLEQVARRRP